MPKQKLLTEKLVRRFAKIGDQQDKKDPIVVCKFFDPSGPATWLMTEYDPTRKCFFGWADLGDPQNAEYGYTALAEIDAVRNYFGLSIERDEHFPECPMSKAREKCGI